MGLCGYSEALVVPISVDYATRRRVLGTQAALHLPESGACSQNGHGLPRRGWRCPSCQGILIQQHSGEAAPAGPARRGSARLGSAQRCRSCWRGRSRGATGGCSPCRRHVPHELASFRSEALSSRSTLNTPPAIFNGIEKRTKPFKNLRNQSKCPHVTPSACSYILINDKKEWGNNI